MAKKATQKKGKKARELEPFTGYNPIRRKGTVNWFKYEIKAMTDAFNRRYRHTRESGDLPPQFEDMREELYKYSGKSTPRGSKNVIGYGISGKNKTWLKRQYDELRLSLKADIWSPEAKAEISTRENEAYNAFKENQVLDWSYNKWKDMVDILGHLDSTILHGFGYEDKHIHNGSATAKGKKAKTLQINGYSKKGNGKIGNSSLINAYSYAYDRGIDLLSLIQRVDKSASGQGLQPKDMIDNLWKAIKEEMKTEMSVKGFDVYSSDLQDDLYKEIKKEIDEEEKRRK